MSTWNELKACNKVKNAYRAKLQRAIEALEYALKSSQNPILKAEIEKALKEIRGDNEMP